MARFNQSFFFLLSGISLGVFTELFLPEPDKARVGAHLMEHLFLNDAQIDHSAVFWESAENHIGLLALLFVSGLTSFGVPAAYISLLGKGTALGFSAAFLMESMAFRGALAMLTAILPPHLLILPALLLAASAAGSYSKSAMGNRRKRSLSKEPGPYCLSFVLPLILILIAALWEAFISPAFLQLTGSR